MRPIDADTLEQTIAEEFHGISATGFIRFMRDKTSVEVYNRVRDLINNAPTIPLPDFKEGYKQAILDGKTNYSRPQGEWKETKYETAIGIIYRQTQCSNCGWEHEPPMWWNFCPNCGAEMRKEAENDDS